MTHFEKLDLIADSYIPLILAYSVYTITQTFKASKKSGFIKSIQLLSLIALVYITQAVDNYFYIWKSFSYDYSTHTAFSLAIVLFFIHENIKITLILVGTFFCYLLLMIYQKYHTPEDIITTAIILTPFMYFISVVTRNMLSGTKPNTP
ncbi:hypothetical protein MNBD_GAMMA09-1251 [hydrothermal vent metagenome]|uniref:Phosphatidic acid phosphatase type 2/haloperoxidase domain-containing protein n=1 Tax=hydrothermal vent metagenome TaxID=652676 RepID=A0A3B0XQZ1_9ZZZZ